MAKSIKHTHFKSISFFELSIYCVCRGVNDNKGKPLCYSSPLSISQFFKEIGFLHEFYSEPLHILKDDFFHEDFLKINNIPYSVVEDSDELAISNKDYGDSLIGNEFDESAKILSDEESDESDDAFSMGDTKLASDVGSVSKNVENDQNFPSRAYNRGAVDVYLKDVKEAKDFFVLLVNYTDVSSPHNVTRDIKSGVRDETELLSHQGQDRSSHIVIFKEIIDGKCQCLVERNAGLSMAVISSFLEFLACSVSRSKKYKNLFKVDDPKQAVDADGKIKKRTIRPKFELQGLPSSKFIDDLDNGVINNVFLVGDAKKYAGTDIEVPDQFEEIKIKIRPDSSSSDSWKSLLPEFLKVGKSYNLDKLRVSFKDPAGKTRTEDIDVDFDISSQDMEYVKKSRIGMAIRPKSSYNQVKVSILRKVLEAMDE